MNLFLFFFPVLNPHKNNIFKFSFGPIEIGIMTFQSECIKMVCANKLIMSIHRSFNQWLSQEKVYEKQKQIRMICILVLSLFASQVSQIGVARTQTDGILIECIFVLFRRLPGQLLSSHHQTILPAWMQWTDSWVTLACQRFHNSQHLVLVVRGRHSHSSNHNHKDKDRLSLVSGLSDSQHSQIHSMLYQAITHHQRVQLAVVAAAAIAALPQPIQNKNAFFLVRIIGLESGEKYN